MRVLLVKLSSLGDVVHSYPALSDVARARPDVTVDWLVEEAFSDLAALHPAVADVIPARLRAMKGQGPLAMIAHLRDLRRRLSGRYDLVIDAQGLIKSAVMARLACRAVAGLSRAHAREPVAALAYRTTFDLPVLQNAAMRTRKLFAGALGYALDGLPLDHGLDVDGLARQGRETLRDAGVSIPPVALLHGSAWPSKTWQPSRWRDVAQRLTDRGIPVVLTAGDAAERAVAEDICAGIADARVLPALSLSDLAGALAACAAVAGTDSGLTHLAEALGRPGVMLLGPTDPRRTGPLGDAMTALVSDHPAAPCYNRTCTHAATGEGCMDAIAADAVSAALDAALSSAPPAQGHAAR